MDCRRSRGTVRVVVEKPILATDGLTGLDLDFALQIEDAGTLRSTPAFVPGKQFLRRAARPERRKIPSCSAAALEKVAAYSAPRRAGYGISRDALRGRKILLWHRVIFRSLHRCLDLGLSGSRPMNGFKIFAPPSSGTVIFSFAGQGFPGA